LGLPDERFRRTTVRTQNTSFDLMALSLEVHRMLRNRRSKWIGRSFLLSARQTEEEATS
jgi:hypothetical protein